MLSRLGPFAPVTPVTKRLTLAALALVLVLAFVTCLASVELAAAVAPPKCNDLKATIVGTPGDDEITGTGAADVIVALAGDDVVRGAGGNDVICGGPGADVLRGGKGADLLRGSRGADLLVGGAGKDQLRGGKSSDDLRGGQGDDLLAGGKGVDGCDGGPGFNTLTRCENVPTEQPVATDDTASTTEDAATSVDVLANDTDPDGDALLVVSVDTAGTKGAVTITRGGTGLSYDPNGQLESLGTGDSGADAFSYTVSDGKGGTDTASVTVTIAGIDDAPRAVNDTTTVAEDATATTIDVRANDTDVDGGPKTIESATQPAKGTVVITNAGDDLTYEPDANYCSSGPAPDDTFTYTLNGGSTATVAVTVTCVDDPGTAADDTATVTEDDPATTIDVLANDTDVDAITITRVTQPTNGTVVITDNGDDLTYEPAPNYCNSGAGPDDTFTYTINGGDTATVSITVTCVDDNPLAVDDAATVLMKVSATTIDVLANDTDVDAGPKTITQVTQPINGTVVITNNGDDLTYEPDSDYCNEGAPTDDFTYTLNGGSTATVAVTVSCDVRPVSVNDTKTVAEDAVATTIDVRANDTDIDGGPTTIESVTQPANGIVVITNAGADLTYEPDPDYCNNPPGTTLDTFTYTLNGGSTASVSMTVTCVNDPPVADDETFDGARSAVGNTTFVMNDPDDAAPGTPDPTDTSPSTNRPHKSVSGDILAGDTDIDGPGPLTVVAGTFATNDGGSVTIQADGDFVYEPAPSTSCTDHSDFFDYTISDQNAAGPDPTPGTDVGRVTIAISGCVWYVNNDDAQGNNGTSERPFNTLAQAETASGSGHSIFVYNGTGTTTGYAAGFSLKANQQLIGEVADLVVGSDTLHTGVAGKRPTITDNNADVVDLDDNTTVRGLTIDPQGTGGGIAGSTGDTGGGTVENVNIIDTGIAGTQPALELDATTGTFNISNLAIDNTAATTPPNTASGIRLNNAGTVVFAPASPITVTTKVAKALDLTGTALGTSTFDDVTVTAATNGAVSLSGTTGTIALGDDAGTDLSLTTASGAAAAFRLNNAGNVTVGTHGTDNVSAAGGPAVDATGSATSTYALAFDDTDSSNSSSDGINLDTFGAGTFSTGSGSAINGVTGIGFDLNQGNANVTYDGTIRTTVAGSRPVEVTNRGGGTVDFNGTVSSTALGVNLVTNPSAAIRFDGGLALSTGVHVAFNATGGGTISVTDPNAVGTAPDNTLTTTTATALNVTSTDIGSDDLNFKSISVNGAGTGILLSATGSAGGLTVTGTGSTDGSGGTIQSITNRGASFLDSDQVSLANMNFTNAATTDGAGPCLELSLGKNTGCNAPINLQDVITATLSNLNIKGSAQQGINGRNVTGFTLTDSVLTGIGNAADEDGIHFFNMLGTSTITNTSVTGSFDDNMIIQNSGAGSGTVTVNETVAAASTFSQSTHGSGIVLGARLGASLTLSVDDTTFDHNFWYGITNTPSDSPAGGKDASLLQVTVTDSTLVDNYEGIDMLATPQASVRFNIANNTFDNEVLEVGVLGRPFETGLVEGAITGNTMPTPNGQTADAILIDTQGGAVLRVNVANNTLPYAGTQDAIYVGGGSDGVGSVDVTLTNNTIDLQLDGTEDARAGIFAQVAVGSGNTTSLCVDVGSATPALRNTFTHSLGGNTIGGDIRLRQRNDGTVRLPGYAGGATDTAAVAAYLEGRNTLVNRPPATATAESTGFAGGAACTQPTLPQ